MERAITCDCGFEVHAADEDGLVAEIRRHALEEHRMALSHDEALLLAFHAELSVATTPAASHRSTPRTEEEER